VISRVGKIGTRLATARLADAEFAWAAPRRRKGEEVKDMKVKTNLKAGGSRYIPPTGGH
jgi:hypothetical protein